MNFSPGSVNMRHRGISLNIRSYYLAFLDVVIFNIFIISRYCCLSCFCRAANTLTSIRGSAEARKTTVSRNNENIKNNNIEKY